MGESRVRLLLSMIVLSGLLLLVLGACGSDSEEATDAPTATPKPTATSNALSGDSGTVTPGTPTVAPTLDTRELIPPTPTPTATPRPVAEGLTSAPLGGTKIAYVRGGVDLRTIAPAGTDDASLRRFDYVVANPSWSRDGRFVAVSHWDANNLVRFAIVDGAGAITASQRRWAGFSEDVFVLWPYGKEGTIFVTRDGGLIEHDVDTGDISGYAGDIENFDDLPRQGDILGIELSSTAETYAVSTDMDGNWELYTGLGRKRLTTTNSNETHPSWSPAGTHLAFTTDRNGTQDIYVIDVGSGILRQITTSGSNDVDPVWSPDGRFIAFASDRSGNYDLYVADAVGGEGEFLFQITNDPADDRMPDWQELQ